MLNIEKGNVKTKMYMCCPVRFGLPPESGAGKELGRSNMESFLRPRRPVPIIVDKFIA